ncbi:MAG: outer membrane protein assembly factor BamD [Bdellovibrionota bacterium]
MMKRYSTLFLLFLAACSHPAPEKIDQDKRLYEVATDLYTQERYSEAAPYFESLKNRFPDSPYAIESELKLADAHFKTDEFESAQVEYESFRSLHPTHEKIPYVYLQLGKCQFSQSPRSVQKDQIQTELALSTFNQLQSRWPNSDEAKQAEEFKNKAEEKLAKKQLYLANFYISQKKYFPALKRLESLNNDQTPNNLRREALYKLGVVHLKMKNPDIAKMAFEKVVEQNIDDKYQRKAQSRLKEIN